MKTILTSAIVLAMATTANSTNLLNEQNSKEMETEKITNTINTIFTASDARDWKTVENSFAKTVTLDYTSMTGGQPAELSPVAIVEAWKHILPGFESTHHQTGQYKVTVTGNTAQAQLRGLALHYLPNSSGNNTWVVFGSYNVNLIKEGRNWKVNYFRFNLEKQDGNLNLPNLAKENVEKDISQPKHQLSTTNKRVAEEFFSALEALDINRFLNVWQQDAKQVMPLSPVNFPKVLTGKEAIYNQYKSLPENFNSMRFPREVYATSDPDVVIVKYAGIIPLQSGGSYNNNYVGVFEIKNGKINTFTEYFDPVILSEFFGLQLESNFNVKSTEPKVEKVSFISEGLILKGNLYLPANFDATKKYPAVIVTGSWTSVKEQMAGVYAQKMAQQGFVALAFDFRYWGESEGQPRQYENPEAKTIDIKNAATYILSLPYVNSNELSGLSICASAGYMAKAVSEDARIKKLVTVAAWLHTPQVAKMIYDNWPDKYEGLIAKGNAAAEKFRKTGTTDYVVACSDTDPNAAMYVPNGRFPYYIDSTLGAIPEYTNKFALMSWPKWLQYDAIASSQNISQPVYMIHSEKAALPDGARQFYSNLKGNKNIDWINEYSQIEFYYKEDAVNSAISKITAWLLN